MARSTVADSIIKGIQLAAGSRLEDTDRLTAIEARKEQILSSRLARQQSEKMFPAQLQEAQSKAAKATYELGIAPEKNALDMDSTRATTASTRATRAKTEGETRRSAREANVSNTAENAGRTLDVIFNQSSNAISIGDTGVRVNSTELLDKNPTAAIDLINDYENLRTIRTDGSLADTRITGFQTSKVDGRMFYTPLVQSPETGQSVPMTKGATSGGKDEPVFFSPEDLDAFFSNAFAYVASAGGKNSGAFQVEGNRRIIEAAAEQGALVQASTVMKEGVKNSPAPEAAVRGLNYVLDKAMYEGDTEVLAEIARDQGLGDEFAVELAAQREAFENEYLDRRMEPSNPRYQDPLSVGLTPEIEPNPALVRARGAAQKDAEVRSESQRAEARSELRSRMAEAGESLPEFKANIPKLSAIIKRGGKLLNDQEEQEVRSVLNAALEPGEALSEEKFVEVVQQRPEIAPNVIAFFAQAVPETEDPSKRFQALLNLAERGAADRSKNDAVDDQRADEQLALEQEKYNDERIANIRALQAENTDGILDVAGEILAHINGEDFSRSGKQNPAESAKFKNNMDKLVVRANRAGAGRTAEGKQIARDTVADVLRQVMLDQGSLGFVGDVKDFFFRRQGPQQLGGGRFDRLVVSMDGSKIAFEDPSGGDVVYQGEISRGQLESIFGKRTASDLIKMIPDSQKKSF